MPPTIALFGCLCLILALFVLDRRWRQPISIGGWIPLFWALLQGSRPISAWFARSEVNSLQAVYEGNPLDRTVILILVATGLLVLLVRRFNWLQFASANKWVIVFFAYLCLSLLWSDYTFIAFKRWIRDAGNLIMVLVVVSEANPLSAAKALFIRAAYVLVPLSFLVTRYFPEIGRYYDQWGRAYDAAIAADKNMLGLTLTVLSLALVWGIIDGGKEKASSGKKLEISVYAMLLTMIAWLMKMADSATATACIVLGTMTMIVLGLNSIRRTLRLWITVGIMTAALISVPDVRTMLLEPIVELLGRNMTFTGRDVVWEVLLQEDVNPIVGTGAYSFWMGSRIDVGIPGIPGANEAHNAYLEVYLNVGLVGLALYLVILASATRKTVGQLVRGESGEWDRFRLSFVIVTVVYGITEAVVRQNLIWLGLLLFVSRVSPLREDARAPTKPRQSSVPPASVLVRRNKSMPIDVHRVGRSPSGSSPA